MVCKYAWYDMFCVVVCYRTGYFVVCCYVVLCDVAYGCVVLCDVVCCVL